MTPVTETPVTETPAAHSNTPAPMETGGVGDSQSWAEQVEAGIDEEFKKDRPVKRRQSQSRRWEERPMLPFPLQDSEGRQAHLHFTALQTCGRAACGLPQCGHPRDHSSPSGDDAA